MCIYNIYICIYIYTTYTYTPQILGHQEQANDDLATTPMPEYLKSIRLLNPYSCYGSLVGDHPIISIHQSPVWHIHFF